MMGDIHHYAWRARHRNQTVYINKRDSERFGDWTSMQCAVSQPKNAASPLAHHNAAGLCLLLMGTFCTFSPADWLVT